MTRKLFIFFFLLNFISCAELQNVINNIPGGLTQAEIGKALRQALDKGIDQQVTKLTQEDGFYKNQLVRIVLPEELQAVDNSLRRIGLGAVADEGIKALNRAAEDAVKTATPIFINAVKQITFNDAKNILLGENNAATSYLVSKTQQNLYNNFSPVIQNSFDKVGADKVWESLITRYNAIPFTKKVNPDLTDYVTQEALKGVFTMIEMEEKNIRNNINARTTTLMKKAFALQDK